MVVRLFVSPTGIRTLYMTQLAQLDTVICLFVCWAVVLSLGNDIVKSVKISENTPK